MALKVVDEILKLAVIIERIVREVRGHNAELASQLSRAWCRVATGAGEGQSRRGAKGRNRLDDAKGEAKEAHVALRYVRTCGYAEVSDELLDRVDQVVAILYTLAHRPRRR